MHPSLRPAARLLLAAAVACGCATAALARTATDALPDVAASALPKEAREVLVLIHAGGPFRHERDGVTFGNRERLLPIKPKGYYREYTVRTPGVRTRGARRIVCGGPPVTPDACYYTPDHYRSYSRIRE